ncbi:MAG: acylphosphatase [Candidatus Diapherotrites archaeon]|nr:acylphosphatase [Candidatus Diapherotrites archaeon]
MKRACEIIVKGNVQKTAFRPFVRQLAKKCRLFGSVENLSNYDEDVRIICEGAEARMQKFLGRLRNPSKEDREETSAEITGIRIKRIPLSGEFDNFTIIRNADEVAERLDEGLIIMSKGFRAQEKSFESLGGKMDRNFESLDRSANKNFKLLGKNTNKNFKSLGGRIDSNFSSLDTKYGSISGILVRINRNLERLVNYPRLKARA